LGGKWHCVKEENQEESQKANSIQFRPITMQSFMVGAFGNGD
jgi:hypothetical protein